MNALRTLKISVTSNVRNFNIPKILENNEAIENLFLVVDSSQIDLGNEMNGEWPSKLNNVTIMGRQFKFLSERFFRVSQHHYHLISHHVLDKFYL